ncbi:MAG TPA: AarF/ABC1/UbiB kinase family protein [Kofleriaceae bacterium]|nr:AarF/ABC1/UbiB kinase family protein [Kofleriaceae bacterium]
MLTGKLGWSMAKRMVRGAKTDEQDVNRAVEKAEDLVAKLGGLKGLVMKAGQIASYMPSGLPPEAQKVLAKLQSASPPLAFESIAAVIEEQLGAAPDDLFDDFARAPFAAASIGQVHAARLRDDGGEVAVKVQYPGIEGLIKGDLKTVGLLVRMSTLGAAVDGGALHEELAARLVEECDYVREADNQALFAALLAKIDGAHVPAVVRSRSRARVLTTARSRAMRFDDFVARAPQDAKDRAGAIIFRTCWESLYRHCIYNADPHPGNYLLDLRGDVTFLDFGCVRRFDPAMIATWKATARAILGGDRAGFRRGFEALGFVGRARKFDWDAQWDAMQYVYRPLTEPDFRFTPEYVRGSFGPLMFDNPNRLRIAMPPEWLFLNRLQWGLNAVLAELRAHAPWGEMFRAVAYGPEAPA